MYSRDLAAIGFQLRVRLRKILGIFTSASLTEQTFFSINKRI